jgi:hypothetical protein
MAFLLDQLLPCRRSDPWHKSLLKFFRLVPNDTPRQLIHSVLTLCAEIFSHVINKKPFAPRLLMIDN